MSKPKDFTGRRFGRLLVLNRHDRVKNIARWLCLCDCGTEKVIWQNSLATGDTVSCGCFKREDSSRRRKEAALPPHVRAMKRVKKVESGCWEFQGVLDPKGYGRVDSSFVHRVIYAAYVGPIGDLCVLHKCDNPKCCNPEHLFLGTMADNTEDMRRKGRMVVGEASHHAKLTDAKVREIRQKAIDMKPTQKSDRQTFLKLAEEYDFSYGGIYAVIKRINWKHVE